MKMIVVVVLALVALAAAAPADVPEPVKIIRSDFEQDPSTGGYVFSFETEDGISRTETGEVKEVLDEENKPHKVVTVRGSYTYLVDGKPETVNYSADEKGYQTDIVANTNPSRRCRSRSPRRIAAVSYAVDVEPVKTLRSEFLQQPEGSYVFSFEWEDGVSRSETGELKEALDEENKPHKVVSVRGSYSYTDNDGKLETVNYYADETGYHADGESIH